MAGGTRDAADLRPGKIIAVHLAYVSRAEQRGRRPAAPSYFLKPGSSVGRSGDDVERPAGTELLAFEGEIALVIGRPARRVSLDAAWDHVAGVTAANDLGVYDLRAADRGSNLRSKGRDGYTPLGPRVLDARDVDPAGLRVRTWVNGHLAQEDTTAPDRILFPLPQLVADLSQHVTLETGDVILTGTPAGSSVIGPGDVVEVEVDAVPRAGSVRDRASDREAEPSAGSARVSAVPRARGIDGADGAAAEVLSSGRLVTRVFAGDVPFDAAIGALPAVDDDQRAEAWGSRAAAGLDAPAGLEAPIDLDARVGARSSGTGDRPDTEGNR